MSLQRGGIKDVEKQPLGRCRWTNAAPTHGKSSKTHHSSGCHQQAYQHEATVQTVVCQTAGHPQHVAPHKGYKGPDLRVLPWESHKCFRDQRAHPLGKHSSSGLFMQLFSLSRKTTSPNQNNLHMANAIQSKISNIATSQKFVASASVLNMPEPLHTPGL